MLYKASPLHGRSGGIAPNAADVPTLLGSGSFSLLECKLYVIMICFSLMGVSFLFLFFLNFDSSIKGCKSWTKVTKVDLRQTLWLHLDILA